MGNSFGPEWGFSLDLDTDYEERVINQYMDFKPILEYFDKVASKRYAS